MVDLRKLDTKLSSMADCFSFGELVAQNMLGSRIAHVLPSENKSALDVKFTSNVEANRGIATKEFEDIDEARKWLLA